MTRTRNSASLDEADKNETEDLDADEDQDHLHGNNFKPPNNSTTHNSILDRYIHQTQFIQNLPYGRVTRSRRAASRVHSLHHHHSNHFPVKTLRTSFDQLSTSDFSCSAASSEPSTSGLVPYATSDYSSNTSNISSSSRPRTSLENDTLGNLKRTPDSVTDMTSPTSDIIVTSEESNGALAHPLTSYAPCFDRRGSAATQTNKQTLPEPVHLDSLTDTGWDSDNDKPVSQVIWEEDAEDDFYKSYISANKGNLLKKGDVHLLLPSTNKLSLCADEFQLHLLTAPHLSPSVSLRVHIVSPIISITPAGDCFNVSHPAYLFIPLDVQPENPDWLTCIYTKTALESPPVWQDLPPNSYHYHNGHIVLQTCDLATFTVLYREPMPETSKRIRRRIGGSLKIDDMHGLKVSFPRGACQVDILASLKVLYDYEPVDPTRTRTVEDGSLACPIIMLGPHGYHFDINRKPVEIELPIPHYREILELFPRARLVIYQSSTREGEPLQWVKLDVERQSMHHYKQGLITISFPVHHFSFFKIVWDILSNKLHEAKMGVSYFYPWVSFPMKCQAYMEENPENNSFGLEVICFNSENNKEQMQNSNYRYCVGSSLKPKLVRPGRITIKLRSGKFSADEAAGEEPSLEKEEPDFRGREFEKQFACIFNEDDKVDRGTFGKVILDRVMPGVGPENLFEFNLRKSGVETEMTPPDSSDRWSVVAVKELAGHLAITEDTNWKHFASYVGFTKQEIRSKLMFAPDPFLTMMNLYQNRGGTPEEFVQALYSVSRDMKLGSSGHGSEKNGTPGSTSSGISGSGSQSSTNGLPKRLSFFGLNPWRNAEDSDSGTADMNASPARNSENSKDSRKRPRPPPPGSRTKPRSHGGASKRQRTDYESNKGGRNSPMARDTDNSYSSSDESGAEDKVDNGHNGKRNNSTKSKTKTDGADAKSISTDRHKRNPHLLSDQDMWLISAHMNAINWRALGRTLGLEESMLLNLEHAHKGSGFRECAYQMLLEWKGTKPKQCTFGHLYQALNTEKMNGVAKHMSVLLSQGSLTDN